MFDTPRLSPQEKTEIEELYTKVLSGDDCTEVVEKSVALSKMK